MVGGVKRCVRILYIEWYRDANDEHGVTRSRDEVSD